jgi:Skp family chaperone for outer membrane proteins
MKVKTLLAIAALIPGMILVQASGGATIAVVDFRRAIAETPDGKSAITKLNEYGAEQEAAIKPDSRTEWGAV